MDSDMLEYISLFFPQHCAFWSGEQLTILPQYCGKGIGIGMPLSRQLDACRWPYPGAPCGQGFEGQGLAHFLIETQNSFRWSMFDGLWHSTFLSSRLRTTLWPLCNPRPLPCPHSLLLFFYYYHRRITLSARPLDSGLVVPPAAGALDF